MRKLKIVIVLALISIILSIATFNQPKKHEDIFINSNNIEGKQNLRKDIFTQKELEWIEYNKNKIFKVGLAIDYAPIEYIDKKGNPKGLGTEILRKVNEITGLKFRLYDNIENETWDDMLNNIYSGKIDILSTVSNTEKRSKGILFSKPYIETTLVILGHKDNLIVCNDLKALTDKKLVCMKGYFLADDLLLDNPDTNITLVKNTEEAIKYVNNKKADYTICEIPLYTYYKEKDIYRNIRIIGEIKEKNPIMVGVRKGLEPLVDIVNKTIENINQNEIYEKALVIPNESNSEKKLIIIIIILVIILSVVIKYLHDTFKKLVKAKKETEKANKEITRFMTNISHDLRTPITVILGYTQAIIDGHVKDSKDKDKYIERIYQRTKYLNELIEDFFLVARLEDNKITIFKEPVDINKLITSIVLEMELSFNNKDIDLVLELDENITEPIEIDKLKMYRAIENLINNAIKYTNQNGTIKIKTKLCDNSQVEISIQDNGIGIKEEDIPYLFDRYFKGKNRGKNKESFGLGLYITKEVINKHDGRIWVESKLNEGSVFYILI
ncbi:ATP-binding protein [Vallitalea guaymasensis]|uniref:histidine kinase n=1 Tax=Vallitalea guaymasensis TaxID=1185412 RepID=A0A8J8M9J2_9FIRM|nr:transporter substrate-binding domain-containing protein [Vallitalea guaymasensis]QUH28804.1 transporter substrate-binding domain-containing protein [Vallitalea guaymasensis]